MTDNTTQRIHAWLMALVALLLGVGFTTLYFMASETVNGSMDAGLKEVSREVYVDTVTYRKPIPVDSAVVRYVTAKLPVAMVDTLKSKVDTLQAKVDTLQADSVAVEIPITQTEYADTTYRAWVSGYRAQLDSIRVYPRTEVVTLRDKERRRRWHIGPAIGYGYGRNGFSSYVGVCVTYSIISF